MSSASVVKTNEHVTFRLGSEVYALDVGNAREIVEVPAFTRLPKSPVGIRGVINLRGSVVPVLDLKCKFDMGCTEEGATSCVLIVEFMWGLELFVVGLLADAVLDVFELDPAAIEPPPRFGAALSRKYIRGMARRGDKVFVLLDVGKLFGVFEDQPLVLEPDEQVDQRSTSNARLGTVASLGDA